MIFSAFSTDVDAGVAVSRLHRCCCSFRCAMNARSQKQQLENKVFLNTATIVTVVQL